MKATALREAMLATAVRFLAEDTGYYAGKTGYGIALAVYKAGLWQPDSKGGTKTLNRVRRRQVAALGKSLATQLNRLGLVDLSHWARGYRNRRVWKLTEKGRELARVLTGDVSPVGPQGPDREPEVPQSPPQAVP